MYKHILVPTDGSERSSAAVEQALQLARALGAKVSVMTVAEPLHIMPITPDKAIGVRAEYEEQVRQEGLRILGAAQERAATAGVAIETVQVTAGDAWQAIIDAARERGCDLIAMASHGRRGVSAFLMGSVTTKVLSHSKVPVLVYRS
ncbi:universal stress protein [Shinella sp. BYT-45]|uniref:universal stress protein n=1 Tax=Shinella sp. BYT-45 TaxID=3377377 RepID=UPI0039818A0E